MALPVAVRVAAALNELVALLVAVLVALNVTAERVGVALLVAVRV